MSYSVPVLPAYRRLMAGRIATLQAACFGLALGLALLAGLPSGEAQPRPHNNKAKLSDKRKRPRVGEVASQQPIPTPALPPHPAVPKNLPLAAVRLLCNNDGQGSRVCESIQEAAAEAAGHKYQLTDPAKLEELLTREPSLRGCLRDDCRVLIAEKLGLARLIDIIIQSQRRHRTTAAVLVFDPTAKGYSADFVIPLKPEEDKLRGTIIEGLDSGLLNERLTAGLKLDVKPVGSQVMLKDGRGGDRALTDSERDGRKEVRVFLGTYTVHVEKLGFITQDTTITVSQAGGAVQVELKTQPVKVKFDWSPPEAKVTVDGDPVDPRERMVELPEGVHHVEALAARGSPYESTARDIVVKQGMEPVLIALQRFTELRIAAPQGYTVSIDNQLLPTSSLQPSGYMVETAYPITPGIHMVNAVSWRGLQLSRRVEVLPRASTDAILNPPPLAPGIILMSLGAASILTGSVLLAFDGQYTDSRQLYTYNFTAGAGVLLGAGGAALLAGTIWFAHSAANHPRFHRGSSGNTAALLRKSLSIVPSLGTAHAGILTEIKF